MTDTRKVPTIALIGSTGGMGSKVLAELVARDLPVRAIIRRLGAVETTDLVEPVVADVTDVALLSERLEGVVTVISAFNPGWSGNDLYERYLIGARAIQEASVAASVERLIVVGGASSLIGEDGRELIEHGLPPEPYGSGVRAARDLLHEMQDLSNPDWVYVSPPMNCGPMGPKGRTGTYRTGLDRPIRGDEGSNSLSVEDLAVAIVDEAVDPRFHRQRFTVGY